MLVRMLFFVGKVIMGMAVGNSVRMSIAIMRMSKGVCMFVSMLVKQGIKYRKSRTDYHYEQSNNVICGQWFF